MFKIVTFGLDQNNLLLSFIIQKINASAICRRATDEVGLKFFNVETIVLDRLR